jgi:predicted nucleotidyltransferase
MQTLDQINLTPKQKKALSDLKIKLLQGFEIISVTIFGSTVRGENDSESDLDILIITKKPLQRLLRHQITDLACEVNLKFDTNISTLVVDETAWQSGLYSVLPIHDEILKEGVLL